VRTRQEIRSLAAPWSAPLLWYARGVGVLQKRPISDKTSWLFLAAMHGMDPDAWAQFGYLSNGTSLPEDPQNPTYWNQCQHQTWYFWPWHRAYLWTFEDIVSAAIASLGGPADWGLPYWNYSDTKTSGATAIPKEFTDQTMPNGSPNPLFVDARFGQSVPARDAALNRSIIFGTFVGNDADSVPPGVGGPSTPFSNSGEAGGLVEDFPHNLVHSDVGGSGGAVGYGLMSNPQTAAIDPIFWVHHANIDRLWEVWLNRDKPTTPTRRTRTGLAVRPIALSGFTTRTETIAPRIPKAFFRPRRSAIPTTTSPTPYPANSGASNGLSRSRRKSQPLHRSWRLK
jgi:tyrosinase